MSGFNRRMVKDMLIFGVIAAMVAPVPAFLLTLFLFPFLAAWVDSNTLVVINCVVAWLLLMVARFWRPLRRLILGGAWDSHYR